MSVIVVFLRPLGLRLLTTTLLAIFAAYGTVALVGGALYSAYIFLRKRVMPQRVLGNVFIAIGGLSPAVRPVPIVPAYQRGQTSRRAAD